MKSRATRRVFFLLLVLILAFTASRAMVRALPGDPLDTLVAESGTSIPAAELRAELHLDRPFFSALAKDLSNALHGDLGRSIHSREPIAPVLASHLWHSAVLAGYSLALALTIALGLGLGASGLPGGKIDRLCSLHGAVTSALPTPWVGPILTYLLAVKLSLFPVSGHLALPTLTLALGFSGLWARLIRERVRETLRLGAAPGARARGLSEVTVLWKYGLAPAAGPLVVYLGTQVGALLAGAFVTEVIFDWPGMGSLFVDAVLRRDYPVVEAAAFASAASCLIANSLGDLAQSAIDPRLRA